MKILSLLIKILILITLIAVGVLIYSTCAGAPIIQRIDKTVPDITAAPFEVLTMTRIYYAKQATLNDDKSVTMLRWYENNGKKWIYHEESITLPAVLRPRIGRR